MMPKAKAKVDGTPEDRDRELLLTWARQVLADPDATGIDKGRASDVLMRVTGLAVKPADPESKAPSIDQRTLNSVCDLAERLLGACPHCGGKLKWRLTSTSVVGD